MAPFVFYLAAGFILPIGMTIIGILGLFGRGPAAQSPQNSTE